MKKKHSFAGNENRSQKKNNTLSVIVKIIIIVAIVCGLYFNSYRFENSIALLAVNENRLADYTSGSTVNLTLEVKRGNGNIFTNLNTLEEIDTQVSIINSNKIACNLFNLDCNKFDFYYTFDSEAVILKGPSASSAIAILTAKTLKKEKIEYKEAVITGSLSSGGLIGNVGGVEQKIRTAEKLGFEKVIVPIFSSYNITGSEKIEIIEAMDVIEAYNNFNGKPYSIKKTELNKTNYELAMMQVAENLCGRSNELYDMIKTENIIENSSLDQHLKTAQKAINSSKTAEFNNNYYSMGSFCYNANINLRMIIEKEKNLTLKQRIREMIYLRNEVDDKNIEISNQPFLSSIKTLNDFYVYIILNDRTNEAYDLLQKPIEEYIDYEKRKAESIDNMTLQKDNNNETVIINYDAYIEHEKSLAEKYEKSYSYAIERFETVKLWENVIQNDGALISFNDVKIKSACNKISKEVNIKNQLLKAYNIGAFNEDLNKLNIMAETDDSNKYLCIYSGIELIARMNTVLNSITMNDSEMMEYTSNLINFTYSRISINNADVFPLIPYMYFEYSKDLAEQNDYASAVLYSNFALAYADINIYIEPINSKYDKLEQIFYNLFKMDILSITFVVCLLLIIGFL